MKKVVLLLVSMLFFSSAALMADDARRGAEDTEVNELGHKLHPIHSLYGLKISGGLTLVAQGATTGADSDANGAFSASADISLETPVGGEGRVVGVLDFQRGAGVTGLPALLASPNGNTTGVNSDIESFDSSTVNVTQFYYERQVADRLMVSAGVLDLTGYFDANEFANNERSQYLANIFVNNVSVEFGGSENFYGAGVRGTYSATEDADITIGLMEGDGDYADVFDRPFAMAELDLKVRPMGRDGNIRLYYWMRQGRPDLSTAANPNDAALLEKTNSGFGLSLDQGVTDRLSAWMRAGVADEEVAQFDAHFSAGINLNGGLMNKPGHVAGLAYGATLMGSTYEDYMKSTIPGFESAVEHYMEAFCNIGVNNAEDNEGFHISPDIQYIINPGGDADAESAFVYGVRLQAYF